MASAEDKQETQVTVEEQTHPAVEITYLIGKTVVWSIFWVGLFGGFEYVFGKKSK